MYRVYSHIHCECVDFITTYTVPVLACGHSNITYSIQGDAASLAGFGINPRTGEVFRKPGLANLGVQQFNLR